MDPSPEWESKDPCAVSGPKGPPRAGEGCVCWADPLVRPQRSAMSPRDPKGRQRANVVTVSSGTRGTPSARIGQFGIVKCRFGIVNGQVGIVGVGMYRQFT